MKVQETNINAQISWVYTRDLDSTSEFYSGLLGLLCSREGSDVRIFETGKGAFIGICRAFANRVIEPKGSMISIVTDDVDAWYLHLIDKGMTIEIPPQRLEQFGIYSFIVKDPNGYMIEFQQFDA